MSTKKKTKKLMGFKVLFRKGKNLISSTNAGLRVKYAVNKFVGPRMWGGPLTMFATVDSAKTFMNGLKNHKTMRVYSVEYIPTLCSHVWRYRKGGIKVKSLSELPAGTILARQIKLLKKVF